MTPNAQILFQKFNLYHWYINIQVKKDRRKMKILIVLLLPKIIYRESLYYQVK